MAEEINEKDYAAALSDSLNELYANDFAAAEDEAAEEKKIFAETVSYEPVSESEINEEPEENAPEAVTEIDDNVFNNIDSALSGQLAGEIKKQKRLKAKKRPKWWLLSLIPVIGIFVIFIHPISKYMPKWFMALRTLIFACFAVAVMAVVVTEGELACAVAVKTVKNDFGKKLTVQTDLSAELTNISFIEGTRVENKRIHILCLLRDKAGATKLLALAGFDTEQNSLTLQFLDKDTELGTLKYNIDGWILLDSEAVSLTIDHLGGMEVILNSEEAEFINSLEPGSNLRSGRQTLSGKYAKAYFMCHVATKDYEAGDESLLGHQMQVIQLVHDNFADKSLHNRFFIIRECIPYAQTNLPESLMIELLGQKNFTLEMLTPWSIDTQEDIWQQ